jgi:hypothetical protein
VQLNKIVVIERYKNDDCKTKVRVQNFEPLQHRSPECSVIPQFLSVKVPVVPLPAPFERLRRDIKHQVGRYENVRRIHAALAIKEVKRILLTRGKMQIVKRYRITEGLMHAA